MTDEDMEKQKAERRKIQKEQQDAADRRFRSVCSDVASREAGGPHEWRLKQAASLLKSLGYVEDPPGSDRWARPEKTADDEKPSDLAEMSQGAIANLPPHKYPG